MCYWIPNPKFPSIRQNGTSIRKVLLFELSVLDLESSFKDLVSFLSSDCDADCNLFVSFNTEASDGIFGSGGYWLLSWEIFQDLWSYIIMRCTFSKLITGLSYTNMQHELFDSDLSHGVLFLSLRFLSHLLWHVIKIISINQLNNN